MTADKKQTLGFGVITRNCDIEGLKKLLESVINNVDAIYVTVADVEPPSKEMEEYVASIGHTELSYFEWCNDFAAARNFNMAACKEDWYAWGDTGDTISGMEHARNLVNGVKADIQFILCTYEYSKTRTGRTGTEHPKERFIRNNGICKWKGKLHESCVADAQTPGVMCKEIVWTQDKPAEAHRESSLRNVKIIEEEIREQIEAYNADPEHNRVDPRTVFNLGMAYSSIAQMTQEPKDWERALSAFTKYISMSGWDQHAYMAWKYIGLAEMALGRNLDALNSFIEAYKLQPMYSDCHSMLGAAWEALNKKDHAKAEYQIALLLGKDNAYASDIESSKLLPLFGLAKFAALDGKLQEAFMIIREAEKYVGKDDPQFAPLKAECAKIAQFNAQAEKVVRRLEKTAPEERKAAFDLLEQRFKSHPLVIAWRRSQNWKKETNGREVSIFAYAWEEWTPETAKTGIGGSEEAIIYLSKLLTARGWDVHVYSQCGSEAKVYDGVTYHPFWEWSPEEPTDIFISWRNAEMIDLNVKAKKRYLWLHDTNPESAIIPRLEKLDKIIVLSKAHRSLYPNVPDEKIMLSANGIIPEQFENRNVERHPHRLIYASSPDRGLGCLLNLWPKIKERVPDAELYWAYGWESFDKVRASDPNALAFKAEIKKLLEQPGCHEVGRIGHQELADLFLSCGVWGYPTEFFEIFCITAVKAQAAGCIPVCTSVGALPYVVTSGASVQSTNIYTDAEAKDRFVEAVVKAMSDDLTFDRGAMMESARKRWSWENVAKQWDEEFKV